mmetsp:Transcript_53759/g.160930  ORF Transcript_53759/g.160930 Transcript_53759/m.160930 type:complete len:439 (-) Transcript_53759:355-1671(-)
MIMNTSKFPTNRQDLQFQYQFIAKRGSRKTPAIHEQFLERPSSQSSYTKCQAISWDWPSTMALAHRSRLSTSPTVTMSPRCSCHQFNHLRKGGKSHPYFCHACHLARTPILAKQLIHAHHSSLAHRNRPQIVPPHLDLAENIRPGHGQPLLQECDRGANGIGIDPIGVGTLRYRLAGLEEGVGLAEGRKAHVTHVLTAGRDGNFLGLRRRCRGLHDIAEICYVCVLFSSRRVSVFVSCGHTLFRQSRSCVALGFLGTMNNCIGLSTPLLKIVVFPFAPTLLRLSIEHIDPLHGPSRAGFAQYFPEIPLAVTSRQQAGRDRGGTVGPHQRQADRPPQELLLRGLELPRGSPDGSRILRDDGGHRRLLPASAAVVLDVAHAENLFPHDGGMFGAEEPLDGVDHRKVHRLGAPAVRRGAGEDLGVEAVLGHLLEGCRGKPQ